MRGNPLQWVQRAALQRQGGRERGVEGKRAREGGRGGGGGRREEKEGGIEGRREREVLYI
jgi:hypothetical protein